MVRTLEPIVVDPTKERLVLSVFQLAR